MESSLAGHEPLEALEPIDLILVCAICNKKLRDMRTNEKKGSGIGDKNARPIRAPFHPHDQLPKAPCPWCMSKFDEGQPKELYWVHSPSAGEYDSRIPGEFFTVLPVPRDTPEVFQIIGLARSNFAYSERVAALEAQVRELQCSKSPARKVARLASLKQAQCSASELGQNDHWQTSLSHPQPVLPVLGLDSQQGQVHIPKPYFPGQPNERCPNLQAHAPYTPQNVPKALAAYQDPRGSTAIQMMPIRGRSSDEAPPYTFNTRQMAPSQAPPDAQYVSSPHFSKTIRPPTKTAAQQRREFHRNLRGASNRIGGDSLLDVKPINGNVYGNMFPPDSDNTHSLTHVQLPHPVSTRRPLWANPDGSPVTLPNSMPISRLSLPQPTTIRNESNITIGPDLLTGRSSTLHRHHHTHQPPTAQYIPRLANPMHFLGARSSDNGGVRDTTMRYL
ncbi:hypothetical protein CAC42_2618 [Sphaceloma murrayae]|uniref:Uncharacterized protein n=1 Tax=Sphaceloma murrayae TaxID=2082308 RepID=A0A2K1QI00_9PEZI|nr:hypothetical protein CAC42_2618 [Sphaceloma murrayae]